MKINHNESWLTGRGEHKVLIEVVEPEGLALTAQSVTFKSPGKYAR